MIMRRKNLVNGFVEKYNVWSHMSHHFFNIYFNYYYNKFEYVVFYFNTLNYNIEDIFNLKSKEIPYFSFYYYHDVTNELKTIKVDENYTHLIDDGIIAEDGDYETLMNKKGIFAKLAERQLV